ncbi:MAG: DUF4173 domain-containing protein [Eubacteriales bacterium]|nr:DUF4173 domain-containing protein [Eubacteriales bacterium]
MRGKLSGGKNEILYEEQDKAQMYKNTNGIKRVPMNFTTIDIALAFGMLLIGFLYWNLINPLTLGFGVFLFTVMLCMVTMIYFQIAGLRQSKESLVFLGIIILSSAIFVLFDGVLIKSLNFMFLSVSYVYWVCISAGNRLDKRISPFIVSDMLSQLFIVPFANFTGCFSGIRQILLNYNRGKGILGGILGILVFLPVLILVISLLSQADAAFESFIDKIQFSVSESMLEYLRDIILGLPVACYLFGLLYGNRYKRGIGNITQELVKERVRAFRFAPDVTVYSALTALNLIYLIFFLAQAGYFFSAFGNSLPQTMTYAEYARRGFFELCAVSGINLAVIAAVHLIVKRDKVKILRGETAVICVFTLALIATAISKMGMYISYYGLTRLRVYTSWFMILLLLLFVIVLLRQFKSFQGTKIAVISCICLFIVLCYSNVDGLIAKYNIDRYQAGTLGTLDISVFYELSDGAVPYLYELYLNTEDPVVKADLKEVIKWPLHGSYADHGSFRDFDLQSYKADQIRKEI